MTGTVVIAAPGVRLPERVIGDLCRPVYALPHGMVAPVIPATISLALHRAKADTAFLSLWPLIAISGVLAVRGRPLKAINSLSGAGYQVRIWH